MSARAGRRRTTSHSTRGRRRRGDAARGHHARAGARLRRSSSSLSIAFLYFVLPQISGGTSETLEPHRATATRLAGRRARARVPVASAATSCCSATVFVRGGAPIGWRESYQITMAGLAATRLFAAAGAGGIALTAWALRRSGMERARSSPCRMVAFLVAALRASTWARSSSSASGCYFGIFPGAAPFAITVVPAIFGAIADRDLPGDVAAPGRRRAARHEAGRAASGRGARAAWRRLVDAPGRGRRPACAPRSASCASASGGVLGAVAWWGFDIAMLWACFHAFGEPPPFAVIVHGATSSACSPTCCRCRAGSAASTAA